MGAGYEHTVCSVLSRCVKWASGVTGLAFRREVKASNTLLCRVDFESHDLELRDDCSWRRAGSRGLSPGIVQLQSSEHGGHTGEQLSAKIGKKNQNQKRVILEAN